MKRIETFIPVLFSLDSNLVQSTLVIRIHDPFLGYSSEILVDSPALRIDLAKALLTEGHLSQVIKKAVQFGKIYFLSAFNKKYGRSIIILLNFFPLKPWVFILAGPGIPPSCAEIQ